MISVGILERDDVIREDDWVRYLDIEYAGQSDTVATRSCYGGSPMNFFRWLRVKDAMMYHFIGKTVGYVQDRLDEMDKAHNSYARYEFARGEVPTSHRLVLEEYERSQQ